MSRHNEFAMALFEREGEKRLIPLETVSLHDLFKYKPSSQSSLVSVIVSYVIKQPLFTYTVD